MCLDHNCCGDPDAGIDRIAPANPCAGQTAREQHRLGHRQQSCRRYAQLQLRVARLHNILRYLRVAHHAEHVREAAVIPAGEWPCGDRLQYQCVEAPALRRVAFDPRQPGVGRLTAEGAQANPVHQDRYRRAERQARPTATAQQEGRRQGSTGGSSSAAAFGSHKEWCPSVGKPTHRLREKLQATTRANGRAKLQQRARSSAACQALDRHQDVDETASAP
jgi:hypothetical protein